MDSEESSAPVRKPWGGWFWIATVLITFFVMLPFSLMDRKEDGRRIRSLLMVGIAEMELIAWDSELGEKLPQNVDVSADGRVIAGPDWDFEKDVVIAEDGKSYVCDGWRNPLRAVRTSEGWRVISCGPDGIYEKGDGDDVTVPTSD